MGPCARETEARRRKLSGSACVETAIPQRKHERGGPKIGEGPFDASNNGKLLYNPRAFPIRFAWDPSIGLKDYDWRCNLLI
jgi:hypothetical protein